MCVLEMSSIKILFMFSSRTIVLRYEIYLNCVCVYTHMHVSGVDLCFRGAVHVCV